MNQTLSYQKELLVAKTIALEAGNIMRHYFNSNQHQEDKTDGTPVTIADKEINSLVIRELGAAFPDDGVIGEEESNTSYGMGRKWFCDPIDGTESYICGVPTAMFSLGLVNDGLPVVGVIYDPIQKNLYTAITGQGAYCNDKPIHVSAKSIAGSYFSTSISTPPRVDCEKSTNELRAKGAKIIVFNGIVFKVCLTAIGRLAACISHRATAHDLAASQVILQEAGGKMTGFNGKPLDYSKPFKGAIASNSKVHAEIVEALSVKK
jgi:fructose-1,6-bisphosphatase/inositol monophosphatase family enzyme